MDDWAAGLLFHACKCPYFSSNRLHPPSPTAPAATVGVFLIHPQAPVYLLDDPLSAVDAETGRHIFTHLICGDVMAGSARLLVTHALQVLPGADRVVVMREGRVAEEGPFAELARREGGAISELMAMYAEDASRCASGAAAGVAAGAAAGAEAVAPAAAAAAAAGKPQGQAQGQRRDSKEAERPSDAKGGPSGPSASAADGKLQEEETREARSLPRAKHRTSHCVTAVQQLSSSDQLS